MYYVIVGLGILFIGVGYLVTEKNAKYLLSGYNTMSEADRKKVDLKLYLPFFKNFHIYLGTSFTILGGALHYIYGEKASGIFLGIYPIIAYGYFIWKSQSYSQAPTKNWEKAAIISLVIALIVVGGLFYKGFNTLNFSFTSEAITIEGMYGERIPIQNIKSISLEQNMPDIRIRQNGFSLGDIHKGFYETTQGVKLKLLLDSNQKPMIFIDLKEGNDIYYSAKETSNISIYEKLKSNLNSIYFKL